MTDLLDEALALAGRGWRVVPLRPASKIPQVRGWTGRASTNPDVVRGWWTRWPTSNIGIATGRSSGIVVLDVDDRHGGADSMHDLQRAYAETPPTIEVLTAGGGRHVYFSAPEQDLKTATEALGPAHSGLDLRADGGMVVCPPSAHENGRRYEWSADGHPDEIDLAPMPDWLLALLEQRRASSRQRRPVGAPVHAGHRHDEMVRIAGSMRAAGVVDEALRQALHVQNRAVCVPPLEGREIDEIATSTTRWPTGPPWRTNITGFIGDPTLRPRERLVLLALGLHADHRGLAWPGYRRIEAITGVRQRQIRSCLDALEHAGRIEVVRRSRGRGNRYRVLDSWPGQQPPTSPTTGSSATPGVSTSAGSAHIPATTTSTSSGGG